MKEKFLLIDGSSLIFRAFFAIRNLKTKDGIYTNGVYGFLRMYKAALELIDPDYIVVAFDKAGPTFRNKDYEAYKANREKTPPELRTQFAILKDVLDDMNVIHIDMQDFEADDILGTISNKANQAHIDTYLLTGDKDYFQLVDSDTSVLYTVKGISQLEEYDMDKIKERYGVSPKELIDVKGLMGDKSDNIPGVPGIGEKTALKLVKEYGTIEKVYENLDEISGKKLKENLENNKMEAFLSKKLGTIYTAVPMEYELDDFRKKEPNRKGLYETFKKLEFNSFMRDFEDHVEEDKRESKTIVAKNDDINDLIDKAKESGKLYFEAFVNDENYTQSKISYLGIKAHGLDKVYIINPDKEKETFDKLRELFEDDDIDKVGFDVKKSMYLLRKYGFDFKSSYHDLMVLLYLLDPSRSNYSVSDISSSYLDFEIKNEEDLLGRGKSKKAYEDIEKDDLEEYILRFINVMEKSLDILYGKIDEYQMSTLYNKIENPLVSVLCDMEQTGVLVDRHILEKIDGQIQGRISDLEEKIWDLAGEKFNINSPKQLGEILFDKLGLPVIKRTKTGYSTNAEVLEKLHGKHPIIPHISDYRSVQKLKSTYLDGLYDYIMEDKRIRTIFRQTVTATGRISSTEPNLQNIPIRTEEGRLIRKAFVCPEDSKLLSADYSQIELRVLAALSEDENMIGAFKKGQDIHAKTASEVFHVDIGDVSRNQRSDAKAVNFGIVYGISDYGLSRDLDIPRKQAQEYIDKYLESYPWVKKYMEEIVTKTKEKDYVETIFHRRRYVPELKSSNFHTRSFGERIALNTPIQGSAADIIKVAMVKVSNRLKEEKLKSKLILQIHDELILEVKKDELDKVEKILKSEMEDAVDLAVDLIVDMSCGDSWYEI